MSTRRIDGQSGEYKEMAHTPTTGAKKYSILGVSDATPVSLNYLLVMPRFVDKVGEWYQFPLGIPYVSSCMKAAGLNVYTVNMNHEEGDVADTVQEYIKKYEIGMVLTGGPLVPVQRHQGDSAGSKGIRSDDHNGCGRRHHHERARGGHDGS